VNDTIEIAGPDRMPMSDFVARFLKDIKDPRQVVTDPEAGYFGGRVDDRSLVPGDHPRLGNIHIDDWVQQSSPR
jgi:hypothetical protein